MTEFSGQIPGKDRIGSGETLGQAA